MTQRRTDPDVVARIRELAVTGHTGPSIERLLSADVAYADRAPSLRTIQGIMRETEAKPAEWWSVTDASPEEARLVLPVLAEQIRRRATIERAYLERHGKRLTNSPPESFRLHRELAQWIAKLRAIAPDYPEIYSLAIRYWFGAGPEQDAKLARWLEGAGQGTDIDTPDGVAEL